MKSYDLPFIQKAAEILLNDPTRSFTITSLALEVGINSSKLREGFKCMYCKTIYQFRIELRLNIAKDLLENTDLTLAEIAYKAGFDSRDAFGRCFRKRYHLPPREWRRIQEERVAIDSTRDASKFPEPCLN